MSTKTQLYRVGIVRLQHLCSQSRAAKRAKTKFLQESACDSVIRDQQIRSPSSASVQRTTARSKCASKSRLCTACKACQSLGLPPYESYNAPRRRMKEAFVASFACLVSCGSWPPPCKIHIFGQAKHSLIEVRRPQDSSGSTSGSRGTGHRARAASHAVLAAKWSSDLQP